MIRQLATQAGRSLGHLAMRRLEAQFQSQAGAHSPPIFIIGAPRSGTSLLYELLVTRFRFAYLANAAHRFHQTPLAATWVFQKAIQNWQGDFTSRYGHIKGWGAPNEGGAIWLRWLDEDGWNDGAEFSTSSISELRTLTSGIASVLAAPFLNKNVMHSNRLRLMNRIWPDALYIEVRRNTFENARSIVRAERKTCGNSDWWSVRPKLAAQYRGRSETERAMAQVIGCTQDVESDLSVIGKSKSLRVDYADLCARPRLVLDEINAFLVSNRVTLAIRGEVPPSFPTRRSTCLSRQEEAILTRTFQLLNANTELVGV